MRLFFLHGFLGNPSDWDGVIEHLPGIACHALSWPFYSTLKMLEKEDVLIGYSLGGRIALPYPHRKIVISSYIGKKIPDPTWGEKLLSLPFDEFIDLWYEQALFSPLKKAPIFEELISKRKRGSSKDAKEQFFHLPPSKGDLSLASFFYGELDSKYKEHYQLRARKVKERFETVEIPKSGHACHLENPKAVAEEIIQKILTHKNNLH